MQKHPTLTNSAAAAPAAKTFYTVNLYKTKIYVYMNTTVGKSNPITLGRKVGKYPADQHHLELVNKQFPNAQVYGFASNAA